MHSDHGLKNTRRKYRRGICRYSIRFEICTDDLCVQVTAVSKHVRIICAHRLRRFQNMSASSVCTDNGDFKTRPHHLCAQITAVSEHVRIICAHRSRLETHARFFSGRNHNSLNSRRVHIIYEHISRFGRNTVWTQLRTDNPCAQATTDSPKLAPKQYYREA